MPESNNKAGSQDNNSQESASEKLKRLLSSSKKEQKIEPISAISGSIEQKPSESLADTQPVLPPVLGGEQGEKDADIHTSPSLKEEISGLGEQFKQAGNEIWEWLKSLFLRKNNKHQRRLGSGGKPPSGGNNLFDRFRQNPRGCFLYGLLGLLFLLIIVAILSLSFLIFQYFRIASELPSVDNLRQYASQFETTRIYDRNGNLIYEILDPNAGRRTYTPLDNISPYVIAATIAVEDKDFYTNPGFDPLAIIRALWQNYTSGEVVSGASTITQQLARTLLLSPEERSQVTTRRKAREIVLASEITRKYSKDEILELYLNEIYYGNLAYGIEAAAETYFNTTADQLNLAQATFLAGLPQAPAVYDIFTNREATLLRHLDVLNLVYRLSEERGCIEINQSNVPICVTLNEAAAAAQEIEAYPFVQRLVDMPYPHWVNYIRAQLEEQFDPQTIYRSGFKVYTTLDPELQNYAQQAVKKQVEQLQANDATGGALIAIRPMSGEILAMVGSPDFFNDEIDGQVNMAVAPRQPGSSIKPLTYAAAFEKGWTPATLIWDVPSEFPPSGRKEDTREPYKPVNYDGKFHGPVLVRTALGSSYNVPAVKTLNYVGIYDDPSTPEREGVLAFAERLGITTLTREDFGLSLTLGGGDVSLLELTGAYAVFANGGLRQPPFSITRIENNLGEVVFEHQTASDQVMHADHAYLISDILSDNNARTPAFGSNSVLRLPFKAAVKTGTTNDFRDNWTIGYTPELAVGVWIGNPDYTPMRNISGVTGAAPIWADVMQWEINRSYGGSPSAFKQPETIEEHIICSISGAKPSEHCPSERAEIFAQGQPPLPEEYDLWREVELDTWTNLRAGPACSEFTEQKLTLNVTDKWAKRWITDSDEGQTWAKEHGFPQPVIFTPSRECRGDDPRPTIVFVGLNEDMNISSSPLDIYAVVSATENFDRFRLQYGVGNNPKKWKTLLTSEKQVRQPQKIASWDVYEADANRIALRIYMYSTNGTYAEKRIHLNLTVPTLTPTITPTPTETPEATLTPTTITEPTATSIPVETPVPTDTPILPPPDIPSP